MEPPRVARQLHRLYADVGSVADALSAGSLCDRRCARWRSLRLRGHGGAHLVRLEACPARHRIRHHVAYGPFAVRPARLASYGRLGRSGTAPRYLTVTFPDQQVLEVRPVRTSFLTMNKITKSLTNAGCSLQGWSEYKRKDVYEDNGVIMPGMYSRYYEEVLDDEELSVGCFFLNDIEILRAWGRKQDEHCSYHMVFHDGKEVGPIVGCPDKRIEFRDGKPVYVVTVEGTEYVF